MTRMSKFHTAVGESSNTKPSAGDFLHGHFAPLSLPGRIVVNKCKVCHLLEEVGINRIGPNLFGIVGRTSGTLTDFKYSKAMRKAGITWSENTLARYLVKPKNFVPGTKMAFRGLDTSEEIQDVIAYIIQQAK